MSRLCNGQLFPPLEIPAVGGGTISLPDDLAGSYGVVLIYRGSWCPYCNAQLAALSRAHGTLTELGVKVVALSVDDEQTSATLAAKHKLRFPVGHSADAGKVPVVPPSPPQPCEGGPSGHPAPLSSFNSVLISRQ